MEGAAEGAEHSKEEMEEAIARNPKASRIPIALTKAMRPAHDVRHADYCERWEHCMSGKGLSHQHRYTEEEDSTVAELSLDYVFMTNDGRVRSEEDIGDEARLAGAILVIVGYDHQETGVRALAAEHQVAVDSTIKLTSGRIHESGNQGNKIPLKSDREEAGQDGANRVSGERFLSQRSSR